ncbi:conserved hypothetical protein [Candidatus Terasakiella magnetica]|nr:conserved hypothetical protein [Candidatus Terasakiella magnetica]
MSLFGRRTAGTDIQPGQIFRKLGTYGADWVVERIFEYPDIPRHVRMIDRNSGRTMTVAISMLVDPECFQRKTEPTA